MKKFIYGILMTIGVVLLSVASAFGVYDYKESRFYEELQSDVCDDTVRTIDVISSIENPVFTDVTEVLLYQTNQIMTRYTDSVFNIIEPSTLQTVTKILLGKYETATKQAIVEEYIRNYDTVYKYLSEKDPPIDPNDVYNKFTQEKSDTQSLGSVTIRAVGDTIAELEIQRVEHKRIE